MCGAAVAPGAVPSRAEPSRGGRGAERRGRGRGTGGRPGKAVSGEGWGCGGGFCPVQRELRRACVWHQSLGGEKGRRVRVKLKGARRLPLFKLECSKMVWEAINNLILFLPPLEIQCSINPRRCCGDSWQYNGFSVPRSGSGRFLLFYPGCNRSQLLVVSISYRLGFERGCQDLLASMSLRFFCTLFLRECGRSEAAVKCAAWNMLCRKGNGSVEWGEMCSISSCKIQFLECCLVDCLWILSSLNFYNCFSFKRDVSTPLR